MSLSHGTIGNILVRAETAGLSWPLPADLDERKLESMLFPKAPGRPKKRTEPDWNHIFQESKKKGVTMQLLWLEYKSQYPEGYQYSQFCERFNQWKKSLQLSLGQEHKAGEKLFIDYAGPTIPRKSLFEQLDKPTLRPLPPKPYEFAFWRASRVNIDYHITV
ncbi:transposase [Paenibacillus prosopidis]|uniref:HTH IS408-type domain-containing protein n=1 Tax=Paenibacillus prosopidis TaxID=630520 RepID=A0A368W528_9BACL|nr:transposase [Paenibacillus prosopidis]RCW50855.1 hypothetical protein DFP97_10247 [Paenibacillus prosopidis]